MFRRNHFQVRQHPSVGFDAVNLVPRERVGEVNGSATVSAAHVDDDFIAGGRGMFLNIVGRRIKMFRGIREEFTLNVMEKPGTSFEGQQIKTDGSFRNILEHKKVSDVTNQSARSWLRSDLIA